jgi:pyridoxamine 5'-phosphate oxidase
MDDPVDKFNNLWGQALLDTPLKQKSAVCVSTINADGFPESRFVDLKAASKCGLVFCTYLDSNKGNDIRRNSKVSLAIWWDHIGIQIRVVGEAQQISEEEAIKYWQTRSRDAQLTTMSFNQSKPLSSESELISKFDNIKEQMEGEIVPKPKNWGGYIIKPLSIEFLTFKESRLHLREQYKNTEGQWCKTLLQP